MVLNALVNDVFDDGADHESLARLAGTAIEPRIAVTGPDAESSRGQARDDRTVPSIDQTTQGPKRDAGERCEFWEGTNGVTAARMATGVWNYGKHCEPPCETR